MNILINPQPWIICSFVFENRTYPQPAMRLLLFACLLFAVLLFPPRSAASDDEALLRRVADKVLADYRTGYTDRATGRFYASPDDIPAGTRVRFACKYMDWHYSLGVLNMAMLRMADRFGEAGYVDFVERQIDCALSAYRKFGVTQGEDHEPYHFLRKFNELDHCGAECAAMIELAARRPAKTEAYMPYIERAAEHIRRVQAVFRTGRSCAHGPISIRSGPTTSIWGCRSCRATAGVSPTGRCCAMPCGRSDGSIIIFGIRRRNCCITAITAIWNVRPGRIGAVATAG